MTAIFMLLLTALPYFFFVYIKKKLKWSFINPLLFAIAVDMAVLLSFKIDSKTYASGAKYVSLLLTPATIALAFPLYEELKTIKKDIVPILMSIVFGVFSSVLTVFVIYKIFVLEKVHFATLLPKSITTAIGIDVSRSMGGIVSITVFTIIFTGIFGAMVSDAVFKIMKIKSDVAKGVALGSASHAIGTAKANNMNELTGAASSMSLVISGILSVIILPFFVWFFVQARPWARSFLGNAHVLHIRSACLVGPLRPIITLATKNLFGDDSLTRVKLLRLMLEFSLQN